MVETSKDLPEKCLLGPKVSIQNSVCPACFPAEDTQQAQKKYTPASDKIVGKADHWSSIKSWNPISCNLPALLIQLPHPVDIETSQQIILGTLSENVALYRNLNSDTLARAYSRGQV